MGKEHSPAFIVRLMKGSNNTVIVEQEHEEDHELCPFDLYKTFQELADYWEQQIDVEWEAFSDPKPPDVLIHE